MNLKEFKNEYRGVCTDTWGSALDAWFECAGRMYWRKMPIPADWKYWPGASNDGREPESYWYALFARCSNNQLIAISNFLTRYCRYLEYKKMDY